MDCYQRQAYAMRRMTYAVDRMILAKSPDAKEVALDWVSAWASLAVPASSNVAELVTVSSRVGSLPPST